MVAYITENNGKKSLNKTTRYVWIRVYEEIKDRARRDSALAWDLNFD